MLCIGNAGRADDATFMVTPLPDVKEMVSGPEVVEEGHCGEPEVDMSRDKGEGTAELRLITNRLTGNDVGAPSGVHCVDPKPRGSRKGANVGPTLTTSRC